MIEILIVLVIIAILVALILPSLASAKRSAKTTVSINNLKNWYLALSLYMSDSSDGVLPPTFETASRVVPKESRCSPLATWPCEPPSAATQPVIGTYGYVRGLAGFEDDESFRSFFIEKGKTYTLAVDIFVTLNPPLFFSGDRAPSGDAGEIDSYLQPTKTLRLKSDGSVKVFSEPTPRDRSRPFMTWSTIFFRELVE